MAVQSGSPVSTRLDDLAIVPEIATQAIVLHMLAANAFINSGVMVRDPDLDRFLAGNLGKTVAPRFLGPLQRDEPNISSDDPAERSTPKKIAGGKNLAVRQSLNQSWSVMDLATAGFGMDPMTAVTSQIGEYWNGVLSDRVLASLRGIVDGDLASGTPALGVDISGESGADALFNGDAFIDARATMGDMARTLTAIAVHSAVYATMLKRDLIEFVPDSQAQPIRAYMGLPVIEDDALTRVPGEPDKYYSYLFGPGAIALGVGSPKVPFEYVRDAAAGNGGGEEVVHSRLEWVIHPQGFSYGKDTTPTLDDLQNPENWTRTFERKRIPLAVLVSRG